MPTEIQPEAAEHGLNAVPARQRARAALHAVGFAHYPILFGIVVFAAGVKKGPAAGRGSRGVPAG